MISGYWLNKTKDKVTYKLLLSKDKISIVAISIVKCESPLSSRLQRRLSTLSFDYAKIMPENINTFIKYKATSVSQHLYRLSPANNPGHYFLSPDQS
jgi:hypothetical protein